MSFQAYLDHLSLTAFAPPIVGFRETPSRSRGRRLARQLLPLGMRNAGKTAVVRFLSPVAARRLRRVVAEVRDPKLHLACGRIHLEGWINVDLIGSRADVWWDLRYPLPIADGSAAGIFHEHLLEHLPLGAAVHFLRECHRLLRPGGILRVAVPDFGRYARDYALNGRFIGQVRPGRPTPLLALNEVVYCHQHRSAWDGETLGALLAEIGFEQAAAQPFGDSRFQPAPDSERRKAETLYVEAVKPPAS